MGLWDVGADAAGATMRAVLIMAAKEAKSLAWRKSGDMI